MECFMENCMYHYLILHKKLTISQKSTHISSNIGLSILKPHIPEHPFSLAGLNDIQPTSFLIDAISSCAILSTCTFMQSLKGGYGGSANNSIYGGTSIEIDIDSGKSCYQT